MAEFVKTNFREHTMFHPKMIMFLFEISVPRSEIDRVCTMVNSVRTLPRDMENILRNVNSVKSRMNTMEDRLPVLKQGGGFSWPDSSAGGARAKKRAAAKRKAEAAALRRTGLNDIEDIS